MKILHTISSIAPEAGGTVEAVKLMSTAMLRAGVEVEVATLDTAGQLDPSANPLPCPVHFLGDGGAPNSYNYSKKFRPWLDANLDKYNAVIVHGLWQYHTFATSRSCRNQSVPYHVFTHGMLDPWFNRTYPLKRIKKMLYWFWGENPNLRHAESVLFTCEEEKLLARQSFPCYRVKESVVGLGTTAPDVDITAVRESFQQTPPPWAQRPYFLFMSRIQEKKGLDLLVAAYSKIKQQHPSTPDLVIAGPVQQPEYAKNIQASYPPDGIHWIGSLNATEKWPALIGAEAMCLTSHQENFGIVVAEALAVGTPVLISNKVNIWREIEQEGSGFVADDTVAGAIQVLEKWLALTPEQKSAMAEISQKTFLKHFEISVATERLIEVLKQS
ncbi:MAG: glycosyltransferase [Opitutaceae bacterium]